MSVKPVSWREGFRVLSHVADATPPPGFGQFWPRWVTQVLSLEPGFHATVETDGTWGAPDVTHSILSLDNIRVGCRLIPSSAPARQVVVSLHGYHVAPGEPFGERSVYSSNPHTAVLKLRARGYPGSQIDTGDLTEFPGGYITNRIKDLESWVMSGAVADVVCACRAVRAMFGPDMPIVLDGDSFGAGLAVIAASVSVGIERIDRLILGLPSLGDWPWRLAFGAGSGLGAEALAYLTREDKHREAALQSLRMLDAVVHARRVLCPVLCKLAVSDPVVPPASAAAVFNTLGSAPGMKWRFVTEHGHEETPMADLRRHVLFEQISAEFADMSRSALEIMRRWEHEQVPVDWRRVAG